MNLDAIVQRFAVPHATWAWHWPVALDTDMNNTLHVLFVLVKILRYVLHITDIITDALLNADFSPTSV